MARAGGLPQHELSGRTMRGFIAVFRHDFEVASADLSWGIARAQHVGDGRMELVALGGWHLLALARGEPEEVMKTSASAFRTARELGAKRFEASLGAGIALAVAWVDGKEAGYRSAGAIRSRCEGHADSFWMPQILGAQAFTAPTAEVRLRHVREGQAAFSERSPMHARARFYAPAIEAMLQDEQWQVAEDLASEYERYASEHPFAEAEVVIARARLLVALGQSTAEATPSLDDELTALRQRTQKAGLGDSLLSLP